MRLSMRAVSIGVLATCIMLGCAGAPAASRSGSGGGSTLSREQLQETNSEELYAAISKLRPEWLSSRGPTSVSDPTPTSASVFMNGTLLGSAEYLRQMRVLDVTEVRYWNAGQASARFGMGHPRGVIEIIRR
jgi:hypothetical protein